MQTGGTTHSTAQISRELKNLARELDVPVLVASQLSRAVEQRAQERPRWDQNIARIADASAFEEYRAEYGQTVEFVTESLRKIALAKRELEKKLGLRQST